jgi:hypothetical protein
MLRRNKEKSPTLIQTIIALSMNEEAFKGINKEKIRALGDEYYRKEQKKCGEYLVEHGVLTESQMYLALGIQAKINGNDKLSIDNLLIAMKEIARRAYETMTQADALSKAIEEEIKTNE